MKTKVEHARHDEGANGATRITIETDEDCQMAQDRLDALNAGTQGEDEAHEAEALAVALQRWHGRKPTR